MRWWATSPPLEMSNSTAPHAPAAHGCRLRGVPGPSAQSDAENRTTSAAWGAAARTVSTMRSNSLARL